jgi:hypothetical protein
MTVSQLFKRAPDRVAALGAQAAPLLPPEDIIVAGITPVLGAHIGPGTVGFAVVGQSHELRPSRIRFLTVWTIQGLWVSFTASAELVAITTTT